MQEVSLNNCLCGVCILLISQNDLNIVCFEIWLRLGVLIGGCCFSSWRVGFMAVKLFYQAHVAHSISRLSKPIKDYCMLHTQTCANVIVHKSSCTLQCAFTWMALVYACDCHWAQSCAISCVLHTKQPNCVCQSNSVRQSHCVCPIEPVSHKHCSRHSPCLICCSCCRQAGEVRIKIMATALCHTDAYTLSGQDPVGPPYNQHGNCIGNISNIPFILCVICERVYRFRLQQR